MYKMLSSWFALKLIQIGIAKEEEREIYEYSFEVFISTLMIISVISFIAILTNKTLLSFLFVVGFVVTRKTSGGYHAKNHISCFITTVVNYILFLLAITSTSTKHLRIFELLLIFISAILILTLAPIEDKNKPLSSDEIKKFRFRSRCFVIIFTLLCFPLSVAGILQYETLSLIMGIVSVSMYLLLGKIKNQVINPKKRRCQNEQDC